MIFISSKEQKMLQRKVWKIFYFLTVENIWPIHFISKTRKIFNNFYYSYRVKKIETAYNLTARKAEIIVISLFRWYIEFLWRRTKFYELYHFKFVEKIDRDQS